jgi:hypothetical protein
MNRHERRAAAARGKGPPTGEAFREVLYGMRLKWLLSKCPRVAEKLAKEV